MSIKEVVGLPRADWRNTPTERYEDIAKPRREDHGSDPSSTHTEKFPKSSIKLRRSPPQSCWWDQYGELARNTTNIDTIDKLET